ncbi:rhomboid-domain-containing protein [Xylariaceae sp. FL0594]|nr:rhomboid-domain-containing protein [Xylariaceae sp. FL0594]
MAANDYYRETTSRYNTHSNYEPSIAPSTNPPPSYHVHQPWQQGQTEAPPASTSPFETVFDDHVYPTQSRPTLNSVSTSQHSFAHDTRYHGPGSPDASPVMADEIPLQPHNKLPTGYLNESNDHVYDAEPAPRRGGPLKAGRLGFGQLGMMNSNKKRIPIFVYIFTTIQVAVFIYELVKAAQLTGSPIQTTPSFNPMIGPSPQVLINLGSKYDPCMKNVAGIQDRTISTRFLCPNATTNSYDCSLSELCGFGGVPNPQWLGAGGLDQKPAPNQWWRFITPIFLHAGFVHLGFNLLLQLTMGRDIEVAIGSIRFFMVYMSAGIFGFVFSGNFAAPGISSTGASGALFGIIAINLLDLLYSWNERRKPVRELLFSVIEILVSFVLGLLPGLDNFAHIGGFIVGLCVGISVLHSPNFLRTRIGEDHFGGPSYASVDGGGITSVAFPAFYRNPVGFFKGRKPLWWAWWLLRAGFVVLVVVVFLVLVKNFYSDQNHCSWCKYLSCIPVNNWCNIGYFDTTNTKLARDLFSSAPGHSSLLF